MTSRETVYYDQGRQAHADGLAPESCRISDQAKKAFWLAGWHDADIESGNNRYFNCQELLDSSVNNQ
jgi:ribosome modulation factor